MTPPLTAPPPVVASDVTLLLAAHDDPEAFRELYGRYSARILDYFVRRTASRAAALDLTAETFAQAWLHRARFRDEAGGSVAPWLYGIAYNVLLMSVRRGAVERRAMERLGLQERLDSPEPPPDALPASEWAEGAEELLQTLPANQRQAVRLRVLEELDYADIAHELGTSPSTARVHVHRGLKALKRHLTPSKEQSS